MLPPCFSLAWIFPASASKPELSHCHAAASRRLQYPERLETGGFLHRYAPAVRRLADTRVTAGPRLRTYDLCVDQSQLSDDRVSAVDRRASAGICPKSRIGRTRWSEPSGPVHMARFSPSGCRISGRRRRTGTVPSSLPLCFQRLRPKRLDRRATMVPKGGLAASLVSSSGGFPGPGPLSPRPGYTN